MFYTIMDRYFRNFTNKDIDTKILLVGKYMKTRVGLKPEQYSEQERKYDELKIKNV